MKYKVGDRVRIVDEVKAADFSTSSSLMTVNEMRKRCGTVMTIRSANEEDAFYHMQEDIKEAGGGGWYWNDSMIAGLAEVK